MPGMFSVGGAGYAGDVNNDVSARNVYGSASAPTLGQRGSAMSPYAQMGTGGSTAPSAGAAMTGHGVFGKPLTWWVVLAVILVALMFAAKKAGAESEFGNVRASFYNITVITLAAAVGIGFLKVVTGRFQVPGLSTYVAAL